MAPETTARLKTALGEVLDGLVRSKMPDQPDATGKIIAGAHHLGDAVKEK
jgi:hypothetical protein